MTALWPRKMGGKLDGTAVTAVPDRERYVRFPLCTAIHASDFGVPYTGDGPQYEMAVYVMQRVPFSAGDRRIDVIVQADPDLSTEEIGWRVLREALGAVMPSEADVL